MVASDLKNCVVQGVIAAIEFVGFEAEWMRIIQVLET